MPVLVTDADTTLGTQLVERLLALGGEVRAYCSARGDAASMRRRGAIAATGDIDDVGRLEAACEQVHTLVHLGGGILDASPEQVLVDMESVVSAAAGAGVRRLVFLSVVGASPDAGDAFRRVKGLCEQVAAGGDVPSVALRTPLVDSPGLRALVAGTPLPPEAAGLEVRAVSLSSLVDVLVALDDLRSRGEQGHASLVAPGMPVALSTWRDVPAGVVPTYRPLGDVPMLVPALAGPWVEQDPVPADAWAFTGVDPGVPSGA